MEDGNKNIMDEFIVETPTIRCDFSLVVKKHQIEEVETLLQLKSLSSNDCWNLSTGEVRCNDTSLVTDIMLNLLPEYKRTKILKYKKMHCVESVMKLKVSCKWSCLPFIELNVDLLRFLKDTETMLQISIHEEGDISKNPTMKCNLFLKGPSLPFELIERISGKKAVIKRRKGEFPLCTKNYAYAEDFLIFESEIFDPTLIEKNATSFYQSFLGDIKGFIQLETSFAELIICKSNCSEGICLEATISEKMIDLAEKLGVRIFVGVVS